MRLFAIIFGLGFCWGVAFPLVTIANASAPVLTTVGVRLGIAALVLVLYRGLTQRRWGYTAAEIKASCLLSLISSVIPFSLITWGQHYVASGAAALIISVVPIIVLFLAHFTLHNEKITRQKLAGTLLGFSGVLLLIIPDVQHAQNGTLYGYMAIGGAALCYAMTHVYSRAMGQRLDNLSLAAGSILAGALIMMPLALVMDGIVFASITAQSWLAIILLGLFPSALATIYFFYILRIGGTILASYSGYLVPIFGVVLGAVLLDEPITWRLLGALVLVLSGILFVQKAIQQHILRWFRTILRRPPSHTSPPAAG